MARSKSSRHWLRRQHTDAYARKAREQGLPSRAMFKLEQIDAKEKLFRPGMVVVDLGAAPGGWSLYAARKAGDAGKVIAVDLLPMDVPAGVEFIQGDFLEQAVVDRMLAAMGGTRADLVLSDMAPNLSGVRSVDQPRAMALAELALDFARDTLAPGGGLLVKLFQGEGFDQYVRDVRRDFTKVQVRKPDASRKDSREVYLLARNFRAKVGA